MSDENKIGEKELYDKAYAYFEYHAGQRMNMLNYFIAVFGACVALYGSVLEKMPLAGVLIGGFLCFCSVLFHKIDLRNQFDVKQSQYVLTQFERDSDADLLKEKQNNAYGVFSNEENIFELYDSGFRKSKEYKDFLKAYKNPATKEEALTNFAQKHKVSKKELEISLKKPYIPHMSSCIRVLYISCLVAGILGTVAALILFFV